jgi:hypothetical protein
MFFPAAGNCNDGSVNNVGSFGSYWSSSLITSKVVNAYSLNFNSSSVNWLGSRRSYGFSVRPVLGL